METDRSVFHRTWARPHHTALKSLLKFTAWLCYDHASIFFALAATTNHLRTKRKTESALKSMESAADATAAQVRIFLTTRDDDASLQLPPETGAIIVPTSKANCKHTMPV
jgi:hypothetical protein